MSQIPLCVPHLGGNEARYLEECVATNFVSSVGPFVDRFESLVAGAAGTRCAVATTSGTAALHIALLLAGVKPDDEVLVSTLTFIAPANAIRYVGAWPVFVDAEPRYWQMDTDLLADFLERDCEWVRGELRNRETKRRVAAILPVHILGHPVDMNPLLELARRYDLRVIEDATESLGATYRDQQVGRLGDIACFSFNGNKLVTSGGGGMVVTDEEAWAKQARYLTTQAKDHPIEYEHGEIGYNYRLTNVQAALGCAQMERLEEHLAAKRRIAREYNSAFQGLRGVTLMEESPWAISACWMYTVLIDEQETGIGSRALLEAFAAEGIQTRPLWQPLHRSKAHKGMPQTLCSTAERLSRDGLSLPCSVGLTNAEQQRVIEVFKGLLRGGAW